MKNIIKDEVRGCWLWTGATTTRKGDPDGYGVLRVENRNMLVHRLLYEAFRGPIPDGLECDHLCRVRRCVNPAHIEPVTHRINSLRGISPQAKNAERTHCVHGHLLSDDNVYSSPSQPGSRYCRTCYREYQRQRYADNREERQENNRQRYATDPVVRERQRNAIKRWTEKNKERVRAYQREWWRKNRGKDAKK